LKTNKQTCREGIGFMSTYEIKKAN